jgi:hypothetical protein
MIQIEEAVNIALLPETATRFATSSLFVHLPSWLKQQ